MSVAFRRESDEEHLEPRFERPLPPGPNLVTARGLEQITARAAEIEAELATDVAEPRRTELQRDLRYWNTRRSTAQLAPTPSCDTIAIGTRVTLRQNGRLRTLEIVGHDEADAPSGRIAFTAPLAKAMLGAEVGDEVEIVAGGAPAEIMTIEPITY